MNKVRIVLKSMISDIIFDIKLFIVLLISFIPIAVVLVGLFLFLKGWAFALLTIFALVIEFIKRYKQY